jgi:2,3-bisphosphoglycerate-dependent phosphoglycerate mutase
MLPYWYDDIVPDLAEGRVVLVAAHGNSLRALVKHLDGLSDEQITELNIPTGEPLVYELGDDFRPLDTDRPVEERYLRSPEEIRAAAEAVARQAGGGA